MLQDHVMPGTERGTPTHSIYGGSLPHAWLLFPGLMTRVWEGPAQPGARGRTPEPSGPADPCRVDTSWAADPWI